MRRHESRSARQRPVRRRHHGGPALRVQRKRARVVPIHWYVGPGCCGLCGRLACRAFAALLWLCCARGGPAAAASRGGAGLRRTGRRILAAAGAAACASSGRGACGAWRGRRREDSQAACAGDWFRGTDCAINVGSQQWPRSQLQVLRHGGAAAHNAMSRAVHGSARAQAPAPLLVALEWQHVCTTVAVCAAAPFADYAVPPHRRTSQRLEVSHLMCVRLGYRSRTAAAKGANGSSSLPRSFRVCTNFARRSSAACRRTHRVASRPAWTRQSKLPAARSLACTDGTPKHALRRHMRRTPLHALLEVPLLPALSLP